MLRAKGKTASGQSFGGVIALKKHALEAKVYIFVVFP
jgi:hypothetical protein